MKITLESTDEVVTLVTAGAEVPARVWKGKTAAGTDIIAWVTRISPETHDAQKLAEFDAELTLERKPKPVIDTIPLRFVL